MAQIAQAPVHEQIAGQVMAEIVRRHEENDDPIIDLVTLWEVIEITTAVAVTHLSRMDKLPLEVLAESLPQVTNELKAGRKIQAIKELRAASKAGLKEAKDAVDALEARWAQAAAEAHARGNGPNP